VEDNPKVYVLVEDNVRTFEDAIRFGEVEFILSRDFNVWRPAQNESIFREVAFKLRQFREIDYLVLIGSPVLIGYAFCKAAGRVRVVKVLQWDRRGNRYMPISVDMGEEPVGVE
jgi:hypothetical protein